MYLYPLRDPRRVVWQTHSTNLSRNVWLFSLSPLSVYQVFRSNDAFLTKIRRLGSEFGRLESAIDEQPVYEFHGKHLFYLRRIIPITFDVPENHPFEKGSIQIRAFCRPGVEQYLFQVCRQFISKPDAEVGKSMTASYKLLRLERP